MKMAGPWSHLSRQRAHSREVPVARRLAEGDTGRVLELPRDAVPGRQVARDRPAEADDEAAAGPGLEEALEADDAIDLDRVDVEVVGDLLHRVLGDRVVSPLDLLAHRHQRSARGAVPIDPAADVIVQLSSFRDQSDSPLFRPRGRADRPPY